MYGFRCAHANHGLQLFRATPFRSWQDKSFSAVVGKHAVVMIRVSGKPKQSPSKGTADDQAAAAPL